MLVNPADIASRDINSTDSGELEFWLNGPDWMLKDIEIDDSEVKKLLGRACVTCEELETILTDIECVPNSRPPAYVFTEDLKEPLPPSHLLFIIFAFW
jgi:hypothetical protein